MELLKDLQFGVLTVSDSCSKGEAEDYSGPELMKLISEHFKPSPLTTLKVVPDEVQAIQDQLRKWIADEKIGVIITTGGTGFAPRDITPEATKPLLEKDCNQLAMAIALDCFKNTPMAVLSRGVCGIAGKTLILNFPGSLRAVRQYFHIVRVLLPHAVNLINSEIKAVKQLHSQMRHVCSHKTNSGAEGDRNSPYAMLDVSLALSRIYEQLRGARTDLEHLRAKSGVDIPPCRSSIKDGYAMKSTGFSGTKRVLGCISAGDDIEDHILQEDECFKINTGAPMPTHADSVVQIEDTTLLQCDKYGDEALVDILIEPLAGLDVRPVGHDLRVGDGLFPIEDPSSVVRRSMLAAVGDPKPLIKLQVAVLSTGSELLPPEAKPNGRSSRIYDSNMTMLAELLKYFDFECKTMQALSDDLKQIKGALNELFSKVNFVISTGGVSMGDKDYIHQALLELNFQEHFGRVNMKPGKPTTFATKNGSQFFFGLPGNPVSAFVTFHLFVLPGLRFASGWPREKCALPVLNVELVNSVVDLDSRPEYARASLTNKQGRLLATIQGDQISSRLQSIVGADVLIHLPGATKEKPQALAGEIYPASVLRYDFISKYE